MEWLDNLKQEIAYPFVMARQWYEASEDNRTAFWLTTIATCVVTCIFYTAAGLGIRSLIRAVNNTTTTITVTADSPCFTSQGFVRYNAPASCYVDNLPHTEVRPTAVTRNDDATISTSPAVYDPPCKKDGLPGCSDQIYSKRLVEGEIATATFNSDEIQTTDGHLQPDYTEVRLNALMDDQVAPDPEKFCGNVLDHFTPGKKFRMVINESKQSDYNGCYTIDVVMLTFGGDRYAPRRRK